MSAQDEERVSAQEDRRVSAPLGDEVIAAAVALAPGWTRGEGGALAFRWRAPSVAEAFAFVTAVALLAERADHHPEVTWSYRDVAMLLRTHDQANAVTERDLALMTAIAALPRRS